MYGVSSESPSTLADNLVELGPPGSDGWGCLTDLSDICILRPLAELRWGFLNGIQTTIPDRSEHLTPVIGLIVQLKCLIQKGVHDQSRYLNGSLCGHDPYMIRELCTIAFTASGLYLEAREST